LWITSMAFQHIMTCDGRGMCPKEFQKMEAPFSCHVPIIALGQSQRFICDKFDTNLCWSVHELATKLSTILL